MWTLSWLVSWSLGQGAIFIALSCWVEREGHSLNYQLHPLKDFLPPYQFLRVGTLLNLVVVPEEMHINQSTNLLNLVLVGNRVMCCQHVLLSQDVMISSMSVTSHVTTITYFLHLLSSLYVWGHVLVFWLPTHQSLQWFRQIKSFPVLCLQFQIWWHGSRMPFNTHRTIKAFKPSLHLLCFDKSSWKY